LSPTLEFKVVVQWAHQEDSTPGSGLPFGQLEEDTLDDYRTGDDNEDSTD
jgi:hypothetical protein